MSSADLSVVIPNYNDARYLPRSVGALLNQCVLPREIIVLDDASTDESVAVVRTLSRRSPLIRLIRNERNLGCCATINRGAELTRGRFLFLGAAADFVLPGFVDKLVGALEQHADA